MLKTIRKFVLERTRDVHQIRRQIVEKDDTREPRDASEGPVQPAEPQLDEASAPTVWGKVKWYNPLKRYGFVELSDGSGDAFLHATALADISSGALQPGVRLEFRLAPGQRGPQVTEILSVDTGTAASSRPLRKSFRSARDLHPSEASVQEMGTVKWYNAVKGFGFVIMDGDAKEVFVHATVLNRAGITGLNEGQRVYVGVAEGRKGPEAASIQVT
jgi:CspA family cold shock protein